MAVIAQDSKFYVYLHLRGTDNKPFYVGKGCGNRAYVKSGRSQYWNRMNNKHGCVVKILFANMTESDAFDIEKQIISVLRKDGYKLCNLTDGGEGTSGIVVSQETREKLSKANKGRTDYEYSLSLARKAKQGKPLSPEARRNMSLAQLGKKHTEETKKKMSKTHFENPPYCDKNIYTFYHKDGDVFIGTRVELCRKYDLKPNQIRNLFTTKPAKTQKGWSLHNPNLEN